MARSKSKQITIERFWTDCLDVRELRRREYLGSGYGCVRIGPSIRWRPIAQMDVRRYRITLQRHGQVTLQFIRISWTRVQLGGERPSLPQLQPAGGEALQRPRRLLLSRLRWKSALREPGQERSRSAAF
jgi:hypothetical protein